MMKLKKKIMKFFFKSTRVISTNSQVAKNLRGNLRNSCLNGRRLRREKLKLQVLLQLEEEMIKVKQWFLKPHCWIG
jgi:hypothetical protein